MSELHTYVRKFDNGMTCYLQCGGDSGRLMIKALWLPEEPTLEQWQEVEKEYVEWQEEISPNIFAILFNAASKPPTVK